MCSRSLCALQINLHLIAPPLVGRDQVGHEIWLASVAPIAQTAVSAPLYPPLGESLERMELACDCFTFIEWTILMRGEDDAQ